MCAVRKKKVAVISCNGGKSAKEKVDRSTIECDCVKALELYPEGILECAFGCIGCGSCVNACRLKALMINKHGTAEVIREKCVGCGLCAKTCPKNLIKMILPEQNISVRCSNKDLGKEARGICDKSCIGCRICENNCPAGAIKVVDNCAVINEDICVSCGMCAVKCPRGVIVDSDGIFTVA
jgi:NAD-dependent dihydropyrimidine dehydrogenase PreA subunit